MELTIGYKASAEQFGPRDLVEYAIRAEELGFDTATVSDHFLPWRHTGGHAPQSVAQVVQVSVPLQAPSPQTGGQAPQSPGQVEQVSVAAQLLSPHTAVLIPWTSTVSM